MYNPNKPLGHPTGGDGISADPAPPSECQGDIGSQPVQHSSLVDGKSQSIAPYTLTVGEALSEQFDPVSVCFQMPELMLKKLAPLGKSGVTVEPKIIA